MTMIHICDYGSGNIHNVEKALLRAGAQVKVCSSVDDLINVNALVIPGVGAFGDCIEALRAKGFEKKIKELADSGVWILGICVGMQVLATYGEEHGMHLGLDIIPGRVSLLPEVSVDGDRVKRPHVGWSTLVKCSDNWQNTPLNEISSNSAVYFVHSFHLLPDNPDDLLAVTYYGGHAISASVRRGRVFGFQFHPEKSGRTGHRIIQNFVELVTNEGF